MVAGARPRSFVQVRAEFLQYPLNTGHRGRSGGLAFDEALFLKPAYYVRQSDTVAPFETAVLGAMAQECFFMCGRNFIDGGALPAQPPTELVNEERFFQ